MFELTRTQLNELLTFDWTRIRLEEKKEIQYLVESKDQYTGNFYREWQDARGNICMTSIEENISYINLRTAVEILREYVTDHNIRQGHCACKSCEAAKRLFTHYPSIEK